MKGIIIGAVVIVSLLLTFFLYCCIRAGAQEDRWLEELEWKEKQDAGRKSG